MPWNPAAVRAPNPAPRPLAARARGRGRSLQSSGRCPRRAARRLPVEAVTLQLRPVEQASEFVGTVKSRRSTTVQPQVEGFVTRILVRSGDRVRPGAPLMQIDPSLQQAAVANLESQRATREAALRFAQQDAARMKTLFEAGASSQSELEQAQTALSTAQAQLEAADAQLRQQRVALGYHLVSSPDRRGRGRHPGARGRQRDALDRAHDDRPERRPRGLRQRAGAGGRAPEGRPARPAARRPGPAADVRAAVVRLAGGRRAQPVGAGQGDARAAGGPAHRAVRARRGSCGRRRRASRSPSSP